MAKYRRPQKATFAGATKEYSGSEGSTDLVQVAFGGLSTTEEIAKAQQIFASLVEGRGYTEETQPGLAHTVVAAVIQFPGYEQDGAGILQELKTAGDIDPYKGVVDELDQEIIEQYLTAAGSFDISGYEVSAVAKALGISEDIRGNQLLKAIIDKLANLVSLDPSVYFELGAITVQEVRDIAEAEVADPRPDDSVESQIEDTERAFGGEDQIKESKDDAPDHQILL